ncbi:MAG: response regulator, partial [Thermoanaerobaculia bacterium]|nr:response regulator [Thermoanaerobaculia bacterium]
TTFDIYLPRVAAAGAADEATDGAPRAADAKSARILLVEDDPLVARLMRAVLEEAGYDVLFAASGREALEQLTAERPIALLVSDVVLPGMSGPRLADRVREHQPDVRTLFISGYTPEEVERRGIDGPGREWLPKPFTPRQLTERVRRVLDG